VDAQSEIQRNGLNHWFSNTLISRLDSKEKGAIIVVQQRVHLNDLSGYLIESGGWEVLSLAAIAEEDDTVAIGENEFHVRRAGEALHPELESAESLRKLQGELSPDDFAAQYQQRPVLRGGGMFRREADAREGRFMNRYDLGCLAVAITSYLASEHFAGLAPTTQRTRRSLLRTVFAHVQRLSATENLRGAL
jgi:hypothetical protein